MTVDLDCHCGDTLHVPVTEVDETNGIHLDHAWIAEHVAGHDENS